MSAPASSAELFATSRRASARFTVRPGDRDRALLECDFASGDRPALVTDVLAAFLASADGSPCEPLELWNLPVSTRDLALLHVAATLDDTDTFNLSLRCPQGDCREFLEVPLTVAAIDALHDRCAAQETLTVPRGDAAALTLRRPTGDDLRHWRALDAADEAAVRQLMLRDLCVEGAFPGDGPALDEALEAFDPLVAFTVTLVCPACHRSAEHSLELETFALTRLRNHQNDLLREIHQLAGAYGWSETEILAIPAERRARYVELVQTVSDS